MNEQKMVERVVGRYFEATDSFMPVEDIADICLKCAYTLMSAGRTGARRSELRDMLAAKGDKWKKLPPGWTEESRKKFWDTLTGKAPKHKVTKCIKEMEGKVDDAGAFCASLADRVVGPDWRERDAGDHTMSGKRAREELVEVTNQFRAMIEDKTAADPFKAVHSKAKDLKDMCAQIQSDASEGKYVALDNWARKTGQLEAKCRLLVKTLKGVEGKTPSKKG